VCRGGRGSPAPISDRSARKCRRMKLFANCAASYRLQEPAINAGSRSVSYMRTMWPGGGNEALMIETPGRAALVTGNALRARNVDPPISPRPSRADAAAKRNGRYLVGE
jgi:hypothetical protein